MLERAVFYSYAPRVVTLLATIVTLPLVTAGLGASQYSLAAATIALGAVVQSFADGGISAAVCKAIAEARQGDSSAWFQRDLWVWARVQVAVAVAAGTALLGVGFAVGHRLVPDITAELVGVAALSLIVATLLDFARAVLRTTLSFGLLAVVDVVASLGRSAAWAIAGLRFRSAISLVAGEFLASVLALAVGIVLVLRVIWAQGARRSDPPEEGRVALRATTVWRSVLREGSVFLSVRLATIGMLQVPVLAASAAGSKEVAAVIAALLKLMDLINGPIVVIGQVIGVKSVAAVRRGASAIQHLWAQTARICACWLLVVGTYVIVAPLVANRLLPDVSDAPAAFTVFGFALAAHTLTSTFGLPIDYLGSAGSRVRLLIPVAIVQTALLSTVGLRFGAVGAVIVLNASYLVLVAGYWRIAIRVLGGPGSLTVPRDSILVSVAILIWTAVASTAKALVGLPMAVILAAILGALGLGIAMTRKEFRCDYAPRRLLNLEIPE